MSRRSLLGLVCCSAVPWLPLQAQAPLLQDAATDLRKASLAWAVAPVSSGGPEDGFHVEVGLGGADGGGASHAPLLGGEGFGTAVRGWGAIVQGDLDRGPWHVDLTLLAFDQEGRSRAAIQRGSIAYRTSGGWQFALAQEPLQWGFGLTGGYLLGSSSRPFPRLSAHSPWRDLHAFHVPLGRWSFETFLGRLEWDRELPRWMSNPGTQEALFAAKGDLRHPELSGFRLRARFGPHVEMNFALTSMWGGVRRDGAHVTTGYGFSDYLTAFFGSENIAKAEAGGDPAHPDLAGFKAQSNALANVEARVRLPWLAAPMKARGVAVYLSRGAENVNWQWKDFLKDPLGAVASDLKFDGRQLRRGPHGWFSSDEGSFWGNNRRKAGPALDHVNDVVGLQVVWPGHWSLGAEYADTVNVPWNGSGYRTYSHGDYLSGQTRFGDFLGLAFGGDALTRTLDLGFPLGHGGQGHWVVTRGTREFRDDPVRWMSAHGDLIPAIDHFLFTQMDLFWPLRHSRLGLSASAIREGAAGFVPAAQASGWSLTASWGWQLF